MKVLFIGGSDRSGSTVLGDVLGSFPGLSHFGETHHFWGRGMLRNWQCGCGALFADCPFWAEVSAHWKRESDGDDPAEIAGLRKPLYGHIRGGEYAGPEDLIEQYGGSLARVYRALRDVSGCSVIVDSSKTPAHAVVADSLPGVELWGVHLVRDPRAVAFSLSRKKRVQNTKESGYMIQEGTYWASMRWMSLNARMEQVIQRRPDRWIQVRYEDFVEKPKEISERIVRFVPETDLSSPFVEEGLVKMAPSHTVSGNPCRYDHSGEVRIAGDMEWKTAMDPAERSLAIELTREGLVRYGYLEG